MSEQVRIKAPVVETIEIQKLKPGVPVGGKLLGRLLVEQGKLVDDDIEKVVRYARKKRLRFGEAAVKLRLISSRDLEHAMATQFDYPFLEKGDGGYAKELIAAFKPFSRKGQAVRNLCSQLLLRWYREGENSLAIVGSHEREGRSYIAANMAIVFSQLGYKTLLVDGDLQHARLHKWFRVKNTSGLSAVLIGRTTPDLVVKKLPVFRDLSIMPAGAQPPNPVELMGRQELPALMAELRSQYQVVIVDTPPLVLRTGAEMLAKACNHALIVARRNKTLVSDAQILTDSLHQTGANIVGTTLTEF